MRYNKPRRYWTKCPSCRCNVFYYENEHGSRVFFDDTGPFWPKHHCQQRQLKLNLGAQGTAARKPVSEFAAKPAKKSKIKRNRATSAKSAPSQFRHSLWYPKQFESALEGLDA